MAGVDLGIEGLADGESVGSGGRAVVYRVLELEGDPTEVDPMRLKDIGVWGTVLAGVSHPTSAP